MKTTEREELLRMCDSVLGWSSHNVAPCTADAIYAVAEALKQRLDREPAAPTHAPGCNKWDATGTWLVPTRDCDCEPSPAAVPASPAETPKYESGWVIEHGASEVSRPRYWGGVHGWTFENLKAVRFAREEDARSIAESMDDGVPDNYRIAEHGWG
jgi:hypothetical protein